MADVMNLLVKPGGKLHGEVTVPGDKSISHRAIILGALAEGKTVIRGCLESTDCLATMAAFRQLGVKVKTAQSGIVEVVGVGLQGLSAPDLPINCGNSGTTLRLLAGVLAAQTFNSQLEGDASLQRRPMHRIVQPLTAMGAQITGRQENSDIFPPLVIRGNSHLRAIEYTLPIASAQVKSCLLLAGLYAEGSTLIIEKDPSRDHTERMLQAFGCAIQVDNNVIRLTPGKTLVAQEITVPGDISSAAFFIAGASMSPGSHIVLQKVGINPTRTGILDILQEMGAKITLKNRSHLGSEPVADIEVWGSKLKGITIPPSLVVRAVDEFPAIFIAAACATGETHLHGASELRVKETDRIKTMATGLQALGISVEELSDGLIIQGGTFSGGLVDAAGDHRVGMAFAMAGLMSLAPILIRGAENIVTSFPNFCNLARLLGLSVQTDQEMSNI